MKRRLYRSKKNRVLCGVCGGIAEYFDLDPVFVRVLFVFMLIFTGVVPGIVFYLLACVMMPEKR